MKRICLTMLTVILVGLLAACNQESETNQEVKETVTPVETVAAKKGDLIIEKTIYGRTAPSSTTPVMIQNPGEIETLEVVNGDRLQEDDLIATIKTQVGKQNIYASKDGEIVNLTANEGDMATNSEPLAVIAEFNPMKIQLTATVNTRSLVKIEDTFQVTINGKKYEAEISSIQTMPDDTGLYPIEATVENKDETFLPGLVAVLHVPENRVKGAIILPTEAVVEEGGESFVFVAEDEKAIKKKITIKETQSDKTAISGDVEEGDQVVIKGQLTLSDGSAVNVVKEGNKS